MSVRYVNRHAVRPVATALLAVGAAFLLTRLIVPRGGAGVTSILFGAVVASSWCSGLWAGLLATALSALAAAEFFMPPITSPTAAHDDLIRVAVFSGVALLASAIQAASRQAVEASRKAASEARQAKETAEAFSTAKGRFLAMISHELRTPLNPVLLLAELLESDPQLPSPARRDVRTIRRNIELEVRLIDDLLDLSRAGNGKLKLNLQPTDINEPLAAAIRVLEGDVQNKHLDIRVERSTESMIVNGDPMRLQQIFWNILRNSIKFTPDGGTITIRAWRESPQQAMVQIADSGIGIEPARLAHVFEAFEQCESDIPARFGGLGLGLAICQVLTTAHSGMITAASEGKGHGAAFTISLPLLRPSATAEEIAARAFGTATPNPGAAI